MRYAIVIENAGPNFSAYVPDLPGCVATGATLEEVERQILKPSSFTSMVCARTAHPFPRLRAPFATLTSRPNPAVNRTRRFVTSNWRASARRAGHLAR